LVPERGSATQKLEARDANKALRAHVEDEVFLAVIALEEEKRGAIEFTDEFRQRVNKAHGR
jgi:hypothetical protein